MVGCDRLVKLNEWQRDKEKKDEIDEILDMGKIAKSQWWWKSVEFIANATPTILIDNSLN